VREDA